MRATGTDPHQSERGKVRLNWMLAVAGILVLIAVVGLAAWATPRAWLLPLRRQLVPALRWVKANWLSTAAIGTPLRSRGS